MSDESKGPTPEQAALIGRFVLADDGLVGERARALLDHIEERDRKGLATMAQVERLMAMGLGNAEIRRMTKAEAAARLGETNP